MSLIVVLIRELGLCIAARVMRRNETHSPHRTYMNGENIGVCMGYYSQKLSEDVPNYIDGDNQLGFEETPHGSVLACSLRSVCNY